MKTKHIFGYIVTGLASAVFTLFLYMHYQPSMTPAAVHEIKTGKKADTTKDDVHAIPVNYENNRPSIMNAPFDFREVVKRTKDAVVNVHNTQYVIPVYQYGFGYREGPPQKQEGTGSGVIISPDGYIVTNYHVIKGANELEVSLTNKKKYMAEVVGIDPENDVAVLKIPAKNLPYIPFGDSDHLELGEWVLAIGYPYNLGTTVTAGIVSAKARDIKGDNKIESFIQTDAAINPGNSGGALINEKGELVGINTMIFSLTGSYIGYSFAIPSNIVKKITDDILEYGTIQRGKIGIGGFELNDEVAKKLGIDQTEGIYISNVDPDSNTYKAGVRQGDILIGIDDQKITSLGELMGYLKAKGPGAVLELHIIKPDGRRQSYRVQLQSNNRTYLNNWGILIENMNRKTLKKAGVKHGVLIKQVRNRQLLANGIQPGQIITAINNEPVYNIDQVEQAFNDPNRHLTVDIVDPSGQTLRYILR